VIKKSFLRVVVLLVSLCFLADSSKAPAQGIPPTGKQAAAIFTVLLAVPVLIGVGVYYAVRAPRNVTGCVAGADGNLSLTDEKGKEYLLTGDLAGLKPDERLHLSGKAGKDSNKKRTFFVKKIAQDYGSCHAAAH
jgi:hypothetical protein